MPQPAPPSHSPIDSEADLSPQTSLYRILWRWHGWAGLFVVPFILFMSLTGLPYLWQWEFEEVFHAQLALVTPSTEGQRASYEAQLAAARSAFPEEPLLMVQTWPHRPDRSTRVQLGVFGDPSTVYVNPYTAQVLGSIHEKNRLSTWTISWHGGIPWGSAGSWIIELFACWAIVLCVTGLMLWWPRAGWKLWGTWLPRLNLKGRMLWRDLHAVTGAWIGVLAILFLATGLPWTAFWGNTLFAKVQSWMGHETPHAVVWQNYYRSSLPEGRAAVSLDVVMENVKAMKIPGYLEVNLPKGEQGVFKVRNRTQFPSQSMHLQFDQYTGQEIAHAKWEDKAWTNKAVDTGIGFHEGLLMGRLNQVLNTLICLFFILLSLAAVAMWWKRKPLAAKKLPSLQPIALPLKVMLVMASLLMPLFGASLLLVLGGEFLMKKN